MSLENFTEIKTKGLIFLCIWGSMKFPGPVASALCLFRPLSHFFSCFFHMCVRGMGWIFWGCDSELIRIGTEMLSLIPLLHGTRAQSFRCSPYCLWAEHTAPSQESTQYHPLFLLPYRVFFSLFQLSTWSRNLERCGLPECLFSKVLPLKLVLEMHISGI